MMVLWSEPEPSARPLPVIGVMRCIAGEVANRYGLKVSDLVGAAREHSVSHPRQEAMAEIYALGRFSLPQIGRFFERDHTTVLHAVRAVRKRGRRA